MKIGKNIRQYRKQYGLTQEQLAEAVGVTVGAVSKWESGHSNPDITMLPELADLFEISVDVLLGYQLNCRTAKRASEKIDELCRNKKFEEALRESDKAIQRYPNSFEVVYQSAVMYNFAGVERADDKLLQKSLELFNRASTLISQNTDEKISELSIQVCIGEIYVSMGKIDSALEHLKKNNVFGINNVIIGMTLAQNNRCEEALPYLSEGLVESVLKLFQTTIGLTTCFHSLGKKEQSREVIHWMYHLLEGLKLPNQVSYLDRMQVILLTACAQSAASENEMEMAEEYLKQAINLGKVWETGRKADGKQAYGVKNIKFNYLETETAGDGFGENIFDGIKNSLASDKKTKEILMQIWRKIENEEIQR